MLFRSDAGNTAIVTVGDYYVVQANSSGIKISTTANGTPETITAGANEWGHNLREYDNPFTDGDQVVYSIAAGNTALTGLTDGNTYYVVNSTPSTVKLSETSGGAVINITAGSSEVGHFLTESTEENY